MEMHKKWILKKQNIKSCRKNKYHKLHLSIHFTFLETRNWIVKYALVLIAKIKKKIIIWCQKFDMEQVTIETKW